MYRKIVAIVLALVMLLCSASALAETVKHERVFAVAAPDGTVRSLTDSIRLENADGLQEIADRTLLTGVQNMNGKETFKLDGENLAWQAQGKDITYQGTSEKPLPVTPVITLRLDGGEVSAAELAEKAGRAEVTVTYTQPEAVPHLAASVLLLPAEGVSGLALTNASQLSLSGQQAVVGWAVPGADKGLGLPDSFTVAFDADHVKLGWIMTFASADPIDTAYREIMGRIGFDPRTEADEIAAVLTALAKGEALPESNGKLKLVSPKINELNSGLVSLDEGAKKLSEGAAALDAGLARISENSGALSGGADAIFDAILNTANEQIKASGLGALGMAVPDLTKENYREVLKNLTSQLNLVAALSPQAKEGAEKLDALQAQLAQVETFVKGVHDYTGGVDQAAAGAKELAAGAAQLQGEGTGKVRAGILGAEKQAATLLLPLLEGKLSTALRALEETGTRVSGSGYDLRPEGMKTVTVYIVRTDL